MNVANFKSKFMYLFCILTFNTTFNIQNCKVSVFEDSYSN